MQTVAMSRTELICTPTTSVDHEPKSFVLTPSASRSVKNFPMTR